MSTPLPPSRSVKTVGGKNSTCSGSALWRCERPFPQDHGLHNSDIIPAPPPPCTLSPVMSLRCGTSSTRLVLAGSSFSAVSSLFPRAFFFLLQNRLYSGLGCSICSASNADFPQETLLVIAATFPPLPFLFLVHIHCVLSACHELLHPVHLPCARHPFI